MSSSVEVPPTAPAAAAPTMSPELAERRKKFKGIYDAMEAQEYRSALRLLERKEIANAPLAKALKAKCLVMCNARLEAQPLAVEALRLAGGAPGSKPGSPVDAEVVAIACAVFRSVGDDVSVIAGYEHALAAAPENVMLYRGLIFALIRVGEWKKVQAACMKAYKLSSNDHSYMFWAAFALNTATNEAVSNGTGPAPLPVTGGGRGAGTRVAQDPLVTRTLGLAAAMITKTLDIITEPKDRNQEALGLLIHTLVRSNRPADAYATLMGKYAYLATNTTTTASSSSSSSSSNGAVVGAGAGAGEGEVAGADTSTTNGTASATEDETIAPSGGSGAKGPGPFQHVDQLRYASYTLTLAAAATATAPNAADIASGKVIAPPLDTTQVPVDPTSGYPVGSWQAAQASFGALILTIADQSEDWAVLSGLGYTTAQIIAANVVAAITKNDAAGVTAALDSSHLTGIAAVDARLSGITDKFTIDRRGSALARILLIAVRAEIAQRLLLQSEVSGGVRTAIEAISSSLTTSFTQHIASYISNVGDHACCFSDLKMFLAPCLPATSSASSSSSTTALTTASICSFLSPEAAILSMPFAPVSGVGQASDTSPTAPLFRFSFIVPSSVVSSSLVSTLQATRTATIPNAALKDSINAVLDAGHQAAIDAGILDAHGNVTKKGKGSKSSGSSSSTTTAANDADPHGVAAAMAPQAELQLTTEAAAKVAAGKNQVRTYTTSLQFLRFLGQLGLPSGITSELTAANLAKSKEDVAEVVAAWECTLPLISAAVGGQREVAEGDDLVLLAAHLLWEVSFAHTHAAFVADVQQKQQASTSASASTSTITTATTSNSSSNNVVSVTHLYAARQALLESSMILECGASTSEYNPQIRLALVRVYNWLGGGAGMLTQYRKLRVKHISSDTLSYTALPHVLRIAWPEAIKGLCEEICNFHRSASAEHGEYLANALMGNNMSSAADIGRMKTRLRDSATYASARSFLAHYYFVAQARTLSEAHSVLRKVALTGELVEMFVDVSDESLLKLRDNDDRDIPSSWDRLTGISLQETRTGLASIDALSAAGTTTSKFLETALSVLSSDDQHNSSTTTMTTTHGTLSSWATGSVGGVAERLLRRVNRENMMIYRYGIMTVLARALDGNGAYAGAALKKVKSVLSKCGYASIVAGSSGSGRSNSDGAGAGESNAPYRALLLGDLTTGSLAAVDVGISGERQAVRNVCVRVLLSFLSCVVGMAEITEAGWSSAGAAAIREKLIADLNESTLSLSEAVSMIISGKYAPAAPGVIAASSSSTSGGGSNNATGAGAGAAAAAGAAAGTGPVRGYSTTGGIMSASFLPELTYLVVHTLPYVTVAFAHIVRTWSQAAMKEKEKATGEKAVAAAAAKHALVSALQEPIKNSLTGLNTALDGLNAGTKDVKTLIEGALDKAMTLITAGFDTSACSSALARGIVLDFRADGDDDHKSSSGSAASAGGKKGAAAAAVSYSSQLASTRTDQFNAATKNGFQSVGASYTNGLAKCRAEIQERISFMKALKL